MIQFKLPDGRSLPVGVAFEASGLAYAGNWLSLASDDDLLAHGITKSVAAEAPAVEVVVPIIASLEDIKAGLMTCVGRDAESCRMQFLSQGSGQALTYVEKHNQALAVHDMGEAAANAMSETAWRANFPTLAASIGIEAPTLWECSQLVLTRYMQFASVSYDIERAKFAGKQLISLASDAPAAQAAYEAITWPKP